MKLSRQQQEAINLFNKFMNDPEAFDMFITGQAGTGKTTLLSQLVQQLLDSKIPTVVCAYTHKAKAILQSKLPSQADVRTLHSFLRKRPSINEEAKTLTSLQRTSQFGTPEPAKVLIVDEFSMVSESDAMSIGELQDPEYEGIPHMKVLYLGDTLQLPAVKGASITVPTNGYIYNLTEVQRQEDGGLLDTICEVVDMLNGSPIHKLESNDQFIRGVDIAEHIATAKPEDFVVLAYTNKRVEELNREIVATVGETDERWSPSLRASLAYKGRVVNPTMVDTYTDPLVLGTKYKTLEYLIEHSNDWGVDFGKFYNQDSEELQILAFVFGHYKYKIMLEELADKAVKANAKIDSPTPKSYCKQNPHCKECRERAKAWRDYLTFKDNVMCIDYPYAMTIHKSQGSTYKIVYIDNSDLRKLLVKGDTTMYLKLLYVGISRASDIIYLQD